jgi:glyoxylase-like metal-dependent hydrolase (beta-lactamase superfamily II)
MVTIIRIADFSFEVPDSGVMLGFEVCGFGVRTRDRRIVIDPWLAFDSKRSEPDAPSRWARISDELRAADLAPEAVDTVVYTHLDGVGWAVGTDETTPNFPNARHVVPSGELDAFDAGLRGGTDGLKVLRDHGLVDGVETPHEVAPGVNVEPAPGHTRTSAVVRVDDGDRESVFVGHLFLHPAQVHRYERTELEEDPPTAIATRVLLLDDAAARGTVLFGDLWAAPGCGTVTKSEDVYQLV